MKRSLLLWGAAVAVITVLLLRGEAWRPAPPILASNSRTFKPDANDVKTACAEATIKINGVNPNLLRSNQALFFNRVRAAVGDGAADTIFSLHQAGHLSVGTNEIFFPSRQLCGRPDLPSDCRSRCTEAGYHQ